MQKARVGAGFLGMLIGFVDPTLTGLLSE